MRYIPAIMQLNRKSKVILSETFKPDIIYVDKILLFIKKSSLKKCVFSLNLVNVKHQLNELIEFSFNDIKLRVQCNHHLLFQLAQRELLIH